MTRASKSRRSGFALIEALIALVLILIGLVAVSKLQTVSLVGSGESKARAEAANLAQQRLEQLRNRLTKDDFTNNVVSGTGSHTGVNATYALLWTVTPEATPDLRRVEIAVTWTDARGPQRLDLNSQIAWDDAATAGLLGPAKTSTLIAPTGEAQRGGSLPGDPGPVVVNHDGTKTYTDPGGTTYLTDANDNVILFLPAKPDGTPQKFTSITGRVYFDLNAGNNALPSSTNVLVRLSSEGECIFNNATLGSASGGANSYQYFTYTCYVGPGWYGNVGVTVVNDNGAGPKMCVGDPGFNSGVSNSTQTSAHPKESGVRTYRGFRSGSGTYLSTGMAGGRKYGMSYVSAGVLDPNDGKPFDGRHRPSEYPAYYGTVTAMSSGDYLNQDFLLTKSNANCATKMAGGVFAKNAGKYVCITPDAITEAADVCPSVWPNFESEIGNGGSINFTLDVSTTGSGVGTVSSSTGGIACPGTCSASYATGTSVILTATPNGSSVFAGWSGGGCSGTGTCTVTVSTGTTVTATFDQGSGPPPTQYTLNVTKSGPGSGSVSNGASEINCGGTCSANFNLNAIVTLTATADSGSSFWSWSGCDSTNGATCTVTMSSAKNVQALFAGAICTTPISGAAFDKNGDVTVSPSGYGICNMAGGNSSNYSCSLNAPQGAIFTLTNLRTNGNPQYSYTKAVTANCAAQTNVNFP